MKMTDFQIGMHFLNNTGKLWRCTDVGTRTVLAIDRPPASEWPCNFITMISELVFQHDRLMRLCTSLTLRPDTLVSP